MKDYFHPAKEVTMSFLTATNQEQVGEMIDDSTTAVYTDGSKDMEANKVGSAFVICHTNGRVEPRKFKIYDECSVFQAELYAIFRALQWANGKLKTSLIIFSDSRSALQAIQDRMVH